MWEKRRKDQLSWNLPQFQQFGLKRFLGLIGCWKSVGCVRCDLLLVLVAFSARIMHRGGVNETKDPIRERILGTLPTDGSTAGGDKPEIDRFTLRFVKGKVNSEREFWVSMACTWWLVRLNFFCFPPRIAPFIFFCALRTNRRSIMTSTATTWRMYGSHLRLMRLLIVLSCPFANYAHFFFLFLGWWWWWLGCVDGDNIVGLASNIGHSEERSRGAFVVYPNNFVACGNLRDRVNRIFSFSRINLAARSRGRNGVRLWHDASPLWMDWTNHAWYHSIDAQSFV